MLASALSPVLVPAFFARPVAPLVEDAAGWHSQPVTGKSAIHLLSRLARRSGLSFLEDALFLPST